MLNSAIFKNAPQLIQIKIDDEFTAIVNPYFSDGLRLINLSQLQLFKMFDGAKSISSLSKDSGYSVIQIKKFVKLLNSKEFLIENDQKHLPMFENEFSNIDFWIHTTDSCNLRCQYCYIHTKDSQTNIEEPIINQFFDKIIQTVQSKELKSVSLRFAGGEPLIRFKYWESFIMLLKSKLSIYNCELSVSILTNLTLLSDEIIQFIKSESIGISVSLDGIGEYHNKVRPFASGAGSFDVILKNIRKLKKNDITPSIMTVVSNDSLDGLLDLTKFLVEQQLPFRYSLVQDYDFNYEKANNIFHNVYSYLESEIENGYPFEKLHKLCDLKMKNIFFQTCGAGLFTGTLYSDGNIYFCQQQVGSENYLDSIYSDNDLLDIILKGSYYNDSFHYECNECQFRYICTGGCPLFRVGGKSPSCNFFKEFIPIIYRLIAKEHLYYIKKSIMSGDVK